MRNVLMMILMASCSLSAFAVPRSIYLASPKKIKISGDKILLTLELPCKNEHPEEWAGNLVAVSDDEGDQVIALGVVLSKKSCEEGPIKGFVLEYSLSDAGTSADDLKYGTRLKPIDLAK